MAVLCKVRVLPMLRYLCGGDEAGRFLGFGLMVGFLLLLAVLVLVVILSMLAAVVYSLQDR